MFFTPETMGELLEGIGTEHKISAAYLYGSYATGKADRESDLDIAVLASPGLSNGERYALRLAISARLRRALGERAPELDLTILQDIPILLQYNVIRRGIRIYEGNREERIEYELGVEREYDDECPMLNEECDIILERILSKPR